MSATIYLHEVRTRLKSVIVWSAAVAALIFFFFSLFTGFSDEAALFQQMMGKLPTALIEAFGLGKVDLTTVLGFFGFLFIFVQLCLAIQAANYGVGLVSIEETERTADFLLTRPVSRVQILTSKLLAALTSLVITSLVTWGVSFAAVSLYRAGHDYDSGILMLLLAGTLILQLFFFSVGLFISLLVRRVRSVTPYSLGLGFGAYVLAAFSGVFGEIKLEYITPFKHLDPSYVVLNGRYDTKLIVLNLAVSVIALVVSYVLYLRRDIHAVS